MKYRNAPSKTISYNCETDTKQITENKYIDTYCACSLQLLNAEKKMNDVIMNKICKIGTNTNLNSFFYVIKNRMVFCYHDCSVLL